MVLWFLSMGDNKFFQVAYLCYDSSISLVMITNDLYVNHNFFQIYSRNCDICEVK